jgi:4-hydroxybenzoate polyprenyltransferase
MKRLIPFPQVVLGAVIGGAVFPGWVSITNHISWEDFEAALPLFFATASWVVYFDVFYATQDSADDAKIGVKSLAVLMGSHVRLLLGALGLVQVGFFAVTALRAHLSLIFWVLGLGVWAVNIPWHIKSLDIRDSKSGGRIFKANIKLGLYLTGVTLMELIFTRVYLGALARIGPQAIKR